MIIFTLPEGEGGSIFWPRTISEKILFRNTNLLEDKGRRLGEDLVAEFSLMQLPLLPKVERSEIRNAGCLVLRRFPKLVRLVVELGPRSTSEEGVVVWDWFQVGLGSD